MPGYGVTEIRSDTSNSYRRDSKPIGYVTTEKAVDEKTFQRLNYVDSRPEYVVQRHPQRNVRCQMTTQYVIQQPPTRDVGCQTTTKIDIQLPLTRDSGCQMTTNYAFQQPPTRDIGCQMTTQNAIQQPLTRDVGCQMTTTYVILLPKPPPSIVPPPWPPWPPWPEEYEDLPVTVGGGWNTVDEYMERHDPVKTFIYERRHLKNFDLPRKRKMFYGFRSFYKYPGYKKDYRYYMLKYLYGSGSKINYVKL